MSMPIAIRPAITADLPLITRIYGHAVVHGTASYEYDPPSLAEMTMRFSALMNGAFPYFVAQQGAEVLGYAYAGPFRTRPAYRFVVEDSIYIAPEAQGRGIGKLLLGELIARCERQGFRQMIALIGDGDVNLASIALHAGMGFTHCGRLAGAGFKHGRWCDAVLMQLALNGGTSTLPA
ncbi:MAG: GNAT family N-acetyltransferase [Hyphomonadaceae bacterium]